GWKKSVTLPPCKTDTSPLIHMSFCPDKPILAGFVESFAPCSVSTLAGRHDDADVICLRQRVVNVMQSGCRVASHLREVHETLFAAAVSMKKEADTRVLPAHFENGDDTSGTRCLPDGVPNRDSERLYGGQKWSTP